MRHDGSKIEAKGRERDWVWGGAVSPLSTSYGERSGLLSCRPVNGRIATVFQPARCKFFGIKIRKWRSIDFSEE